MASIKIEGLKELVKRIESANIGYQLQGAMNEFASGVVTDAKLLAPNYEGDLIGSINWDKSSDYKTNPFITINVNADYAAYVEFGTRKFAAEYVASLPSDWKDFAAEFKGGGGGSFDELIMRIYEWVRKKGLRLEPRIFEQGDSFSLATGRNIGARKAPKKKTIEEQQQQLAYLIARKIVTEGIPAQPYLYPAFEKNRKRLLDDIKAIEL